MNQAISNQPQPNQWLVFYQRHRRLLEWCYWPTVLFTQALIAAGSVVMEYQRRGTPIAAWEPLTWELSSAASTLPGILLFIWFDRRYSLNSPRLLRNLAAHLGFTLVFSLVHIVGMVAIREAIYQWMGGNYDFGNWAFEFFYEYRKDVLTYLGIVVTVYVYRLVASRVTGEASPIADGEQSSAEQPIERLLVRKLGKEFLVKTEDIEWVEAAGNYMNLHSGGRVYPLRETMARLEQRLADLPFVRVHRSSLVNLNYVESITPLDSGDATVEMSDGSPVRLSRRYRDNLNERLTARP